MSFKELPIMPDKKKSVLLFYPYVSKKTPNNVKNKLYGRWVGQGPMVDKFENEFKKKFAKNSSVIATGSGTDSLHLAYILAGLKKGDEVITTIFTCTATNIPMLYMGLKIKFADIERDTMNISIDSVKKLITKRTKAIVCVHYGGLPCDMDSLQKICKQKKITLIEDAAHALGAKYKKKPIGSISDFTTFSFQAIKHFTTGDGGMLTIKNKKLEEKAKRIRWFGIDRKKKQKGIWKNDVYEVGYKYQMTDISATMGCDALNDFSKIINHRKKIYYTYLQELSSNKKIQCIHDYNKNKEHGAWLFTISLNNKDFVQKKLREHFIETNQVHFRNDRYSIFKKFVKGKKFPNMDYLENRYLVLPLHHKVSVQNVKYICKIINKFAK
ncbi:DegT/DnrJ/EryC1/StrS family aminotransferase [Pelagibacteraceae bacterium]|nr:DegT/DnrJ/EryC1/StrS family aminotransferase [Pelagibacteraceae bacterium]